MNPTWLKSKNDFAFTIMEMMVVLSIMAVIAATALPGLIATIPDRKLKSAAQKLFSDIQWVKMKAMDCLGGDHNYDTTVLSTCCWNISARVCQKAGLGYTEMRDHDFGFCKDCL